MRRLYLQHLQGLCSGWTLFPALDRPITQIHEDSRLVTRGSLYGCLTPHPDQARTYTRQALEKGAEIILISPDVSLENLQVQFPKTLWLVHPKPRWAWAKIVAAWYGSQPNCCVAVTGTNGKTSVTHFTQQIWQHLGYRAAALGTVGLEPPILQTYLDSALQERLKLTTPSAFDLHEALAALSQGGVSHVALEASSHGLMQDRLSGLSLKAAAYTNLTQDHLDYHGTMEAYFHAKSLLFTELLPASSPAIINKDDAYSARLIQLCQAKGHSVLTYSLEQEADLWVTDLKVEGLSQHFTLRIHDQSYKIELPLVGRFQIANVLCALGLVLGLGAEAERAVGALAHLKAPAGRLEYVGRTRRGGVVIVDYAHTPDGLRQALQSLRPSTRGKLGVVFGCGGNRDTGKRPQMGHIAHEHADWVIVTDDNPRFEDAALIRQSILAACPKGREVSDRGQAIEEALALLDARDVVLIAGKGHEHGQIVGDQVLPFNDALYVKTLLRDAAL